MSRKNQIDVCGPLPAPLSCPCHGMATAGKRVRETPYQDFSRIKKGALTRRAARGFTAFEDLFTDPSFPPDWSSLTYVYSGDDKYERTVFRRPPEVQNNPVFIGVGGIPDEPFPWRHWRQRAWFQAAISILSMNVRFLDKFVPGYRNHEQNFGEDYIGAFHFNIWRFGEWVDIVVDDYLPWLDGAHFFCKAIGNPPEYWAPLAEKAYANAAFDVDECQKEMGVDVEERRHLHIVTATTKFPCKDGHNIEMIRLKCLFSKEPKWRGKYSDYDTLSWDMINAEFMDKYRPLTRKEDDEYWLQMEDFRCNFGGLIIISSQEPYSQEGLNVERRYLAPSSASVRQAQHATPTQAASQYKRPSAPYLGNVMNRSAEAAAGSASSRVSPLVAVTPQNAVDDPDIDDRKECLVDTDADGEVLVIELDPGAPPPPPLTTTEEDGKFSTKADVSVVSNDGARENVDYSLAHHTPCCGALASRATESRVVKKAEDTGKFERTYSNFVVEKRKTRVTDATGQIVNSDTCARTHPEKEQILNGVKSHTSLVSKFSPGFLGRKKTGVAESCPRASDNNGYINTDPCVNRNVEAAFVDVAQKTSQNCAMDPETKSCVSNKYSHVDRASRDAPAQHVISRRHRRAEKQQPSVPNLRQSKHDHQCFARKISLPHLSNSALHLPNKGGAANASRRSSTPQQQQQQQQQQQHHTEFPGRRRLDSATSVSTVHSDARSCYSASEISIHIRSQLSIDDTAGRPMSAPLHRNLSTGSLSSLTQSNFLAIKADYFKAHSRWSCIVDHKGRWTKTRRGISRSNLDEHSKNPRIMFAVAKTDVTDSVTVGMQGKRHVLISVLQDYRHGPSTANSLLVPIGFCLYKAKHPDRDEKRHVSKLQLIGEVDGKSEMREIHSRFDVDPGCYFVVPYYVAQSHEGEFIVRVLAEGDPTGGKAGCMMS
ncbi:uncharacterized protein LOC121378117 [Gigantopelta aegis]|uniref:uncharacterized protein LOC121378117 n=1 Tax=Gigantopelta aegis TaxID=1735272 RepID=UPI001B88DF43|nr:uncharacterized protein LOC121378117 [Gigantopelta aegis]